MDDLDDKELKERMHPKAIRLPCGGIGIPEEEGMGYRCWNCMSIYGSIGCPCTKTNDNKRIQ